MVETAANVYLIYTATEAPTPVAANVYLPHTRDDPFETIRGANVYLPHARDDPYDPQRVGNVYSQYSANQVFPSGIANVFVHYTSSVQPTGLPGLTYHPIDLDQVNEDAVIYTDQFFPLCLSYGTKSGQTYQTTKTETLSGFEQRIQRGSQGRHIFTIRAENFTAADLAKIYHLYQITQGDFAGFLFMDPFDHTTLENATTVSGSAVTGQDQLIGTSDGTTIAFNLQKYYFSGSRAVQRRIRYPKLDTIKVSVNGNEITNFTYDYATQQLRLTSSVGSQTFSGTMTASTGRIAGANFSGLNPNDIVHVTGFQNTANNAPGSGVPHRVVSADETGVTVVNFITGTTAAFVDETATITIFQRAAPPTGAIIRWGGWFYVPVRFDDSNVEFEPKNGLRETMIADIDRIVLRELFE